MLYSVLQAFNVFQPTHPHGVRRIFDLEWIRDFVFQPTHPHGVRQCTLKNYANWTTEFQPTHPHGVRLIAWITVKRKHCFNPRTRTGCDFPPTL